MLIGKRIKEARLEKDLSQQELGDLLGISKVSVCGYEKGTRTPTLEVFIKLIQLLELPPEYALGIEKLAVSEEETQYTHRLAKEDFKILDEIKSHRKLYNELCDNPKRTVDQIVSTRKSKP